MSTAVFLTVALYLIPNLLMFLQDDHIVTVYPGIDHGKLLENGESLCHYIYNSEIHLKYMVKEGCPISSSGTWRSNICGGKLYSRLYQENEYSECANQNFWPYLCKIVSFYLFVGICGYIFQRRIPLRWKYRQGSCLQALGYEFAIMLTIGLVYSQSYTYWIATVVSFILMSIFVITFLQDRKKLE